MSADIGVLRERIEAPAYEYERRGVVDFVEDDLEDLICSGLSATQVGVGLRRRPTGKTVHL